MKINEKQFFVILALLHEYSSALNIYYNLYHRISCLNESRNQNIKILYTRHTHTKHRQYGQYSR